MRKYMQMMTGLKLSFPPTAAEAMESIVEPQPQVTKEHAPHLERLAEYLRNLSVRARPPSVACGAREYLRGSGAIH
jgi:iron-sulfur cluster repair protein YtfE (RIC family)